MFTFTTAVAVLAALIGTISGYESYNSISHICCNGNVVLRESSTGCCGSKAFEYGKFLCCNDELFPTEENSTMSCCTDLDSGESTTYDYTKQDCCNGEVWDTPEAGGYSCCGKVLYNYTTQTCCGNEVKELVDGMGCCGDKEYDGNSQVCCQQWDDSIKEYTYDTKERLGNATECCNGDTYDPDEKICCGDQLQVLPKGLEYASQANCCGTEAYNWNTHTCCGYRVEDEESDTIEYKQELLEIVGQRDSCCGQELYDDDTEVCCDREKSTFAQLPADAEKDGYYLCCGAGEVYDAYKKHCFNDKVVDQPDYDSRVCGEEIINYNNQSCCHGEVYDDNGPMRCCYATKSLYDSEEQICCDVEEKLVDKSNVQKNLEHDSCCAVRNN